MVIDGKIYNARGKLNAILISCGLVAVFIVGGFFSTAIMKHLVDSIEQNAISSLRGTVDKIDTHNAGSSNRNSQVISFAEYCITFADKKFYCDEILRPTSRHII